MAGSVGKVTRRGTSKSVSKRAKTATGNTAALKRKSAKSKTSTKVSAKAKPTEEQIRRRAYEIYLTRNGTPGDPVADWLWAERDLLRQ